MPLNPSFYPPQNKKLGRPCSLYINLTTLVLSLRISDNCKLLPRLYMTDRQTDKHPVTLVYLGLESNLELSFYLNFILIMHPNFYPQESKGKRVRQSTIN